MVTTLQATIEGLGAYSVAEAARYARMPKATLNRWFFGTKAVEPMSRSRILDDHSKRISFTDFVEALAIRSLRADHGVPLQKIKEAIRNAKEHYKIEHPFARKDHRPITPEKPTPSGGNFNCCCKVGIRSGARNGLAAAPAFQGGRTLQEVGRSRIAGEGAGDVSADQIDI